MMRLFDVVIVCCILDIELTYSQNSSDALPTPVKGFALDAFQTDQSSQTPSGIIRSPFQKSMTK